MLQAQQKRSWDDIVTLDKSWFYLSIGPERIWLAPGETPPDRERHTIQSPKFMLTRVWGVTGCYVVKLLPKGGTLNASEYTDAILSEIACWREVQRGSTNRKLVVHADNARPRPAGRTVRYIETCGMIRVPHLPYSPDLAPSDFFRFRYLKSMFQGRHFETGEERLAAMRDMLATIEKVTLERVFLEWMERLAKCISTFGEYVGGDE
jgi:histone-lysine N-methyltransferase SETMAR